MTECMASNKSVRVNVYTVVDEQLESHSGIK